MDKVSISQLRSEIKVTTARSGGAGGQHVNKVETKVILRFHVAKSDVLNESQKERISKVIGSKITKEGEIIVTAEGKRSQLKNKEIAFKKLDRLLNQALREKKKRKTTQPTKTSKRKRLDEKKKNSEKKKWRQKPI